MFVECDMFWFIVGVMVLFEMVNEVFLLGSFFNGFVFDQFFFLFVDEEFDFQVGLLIFMLWFVMFWEFFEDCLEFMFQLCDDVVWSDGMLFIVEDVCFIWQVYVLEDIVYSYVFVKEMICDVEVVDLYMVCFYYDELFGIQFVDVVDGVIFFKYKWEQLFFGEWCE